MIRGGIGSRICVIFGLFQILPNGSEGLQSDSAVRSARDRIPACILVLPRLGLRGGKARMSSYWIQHAGRTHKSPDSNAAVEISSTTS
ncbi:hypothetical protein N656DRAFT_423698 [Canariomyces notabilis]|uniref:Secreted protein n=1 Tax=Canariomyces notabilis TaxID=2074819 RepID=A0AAN6QE91_9PEZI|nr:hypothetical protein N656DRAFT_423698 [Canariomyces arenarius]